MAYIKYGVVTRIENINKNKDFIKNNFNLDLYEDKKVYYLLKNTILKDNLKSFRKEIMNLSNKKIDSIDSSEAYCLETTGDNLINHDICLLKGGRKYYFQDYEDFIFDTEEVCLLTENSFLKLSFLSLFWDINKIVCEDFSKVSIFLNNSLKKALTNCLKDASFLLDV